MLFSVSIVPRIERKGVYPMALDGVSRDKLRELDDFSMKYEVAVHAFGTENYSEEFFDLYEIKNRTPEPMALPDSFIEIAVERCGEFCLPVAEKAVSLFGEPKRVTVFDNDSALKEELEGALGLAPFFFVFEILFCEYEGLTICFISGSNN